jgi:DNA-binding transcriptional ArsR family regulator
LKHRDVFFALAATRRRDILDLLRDRGAMKAGDIGSHFHNDTQPGISRHLRVLRESGLVEARHQGRENHYYLNPLPLVEARDGWLSTFSKAHLDRLSALRDAAESDKSES